MSILGVCIMSSIVFNKDNDIAGTVFENGVKVRDVRRLYLKVFMNIIQEENDFLIDDIKKLPDINLKLKNHTLLLHAIYSENWYAVNWLLELGANPNIIVEHEGKRYGAVDLCLSHFFSKNQMTPIGILLNHGAYYNDFALELASRNYALQLFFNNHKNQHIDEASLSDIKDIYVKQELFMGLPEEEKQKLIGAFSVEIASHNYEAIEKMINLGIDINMSWTNVTPLMLAVIKNDYKSVQILLAAGAMVNLVSNMNKANPQKALHYAIDNYMKTRNTRILEILLLYDAEIDFKTYIMYESEPQLVNLFNQYPESIMKRKELEITEDLIKEYEMLPPKVFNSMYIPDKLRSELDRRGIVSRKQAELATQNSNRVQDQNPNQPKSSTPITKDQPENNASNNGATTCYIATAVYGSCDAPQVVSLRRYRDKVLLHSMLGRFFVKTYYCISPPLASQLKKSRWKAINRVVRYFLDKFIVSISQSKLNS